ncbi:MAG: Primosomal protein N' [Alphaproteobacteria bacterium]|nr:MAG: Primosomal protein N' [Alphaproteobacteria bacterium]
MPNVSILIPLALPGPYDYAVPLHMAVAPGSIVRVPLGSRQVYGVVWGEAEGDAPAHKIKPIIALCDVPPLAEELRQFVDWVANYVMAPPGAVLRQVMRVPQAFAPPKPLSVLAPGAPPEKMTAARRRVYEALAERGAMAASELARAAGVSASVVKTLAQGGYLTAHEMPGDKHFPHPDATHQRLDLSAQQKAVADSLAESVMAQGFTPHLLDGVTGAGKTEVYFEAIAAALEADKKALILLPEIALTGQFLERFEARFGCPPALWHSGLTAAERRRTWREIAENRVEVLVGARSALFLPWRDLGVIIVDEEHDGGFKQEDGVIYNARDMAVVRSRLAACPVILSTATPSLESYVNARDGRYVAHRLTARHGAALLPEIELVDMRAAPPPQGAWLVPQMVAQVGAAIDRDEQALLFLNRRGYAPLTLCRACGHRYACPACDAWMVEHRFRKQLQCHHCGHMEPVPQNCHSCGEADKLAACGPGVERITEEIIGHFPEARTIVLSSDMGGVAAQREAIQRIGAGEADIIVGTQIIAKGHDFAKLSFVGVVDADLGIGNGDLRAAERTYQLLSQVAGRAGRRAERQGFAMLQSHSPEHPVLQALVSGDRDSFFEREIAARQLAEMPPFGRLAALIVSATNPQEGLAFVRQMAAKMPPHKEIRVLGPAPAPMARIRNRYRYRFLLKASRQAPLQGYIASWLKPFKPRGSVRLSVDIDPYNFL